jgi:hypothetical protein
MPDEGTEQEFRAEAKEAINRCLERGLRVVGPSGKEVILYLVKGKFGIPAERIPDDPDGLIFALRSIFGLGAATILESVVHELHTYRPRNDVEREMVDAYGSVLREGKLSIEAGLA